MMDGSHGMSLIGFLKKCQQIRDWLVITGGGGGGGGGYKIGGRGTSEVLGLQKEAL